MSSQNANHFEDAFLQVMRIIPRLRIELKNQNQARWKRKSGSDMSGVREDQALPNDQREASEKRRLHRLSRRSSLIKPKIWLGKTGVTEAFIQQLNRQLKADRLVKVKAQKSISDNRELSEISRAVASATESTLIDVRGRTFTLYKVKRD